MILHAIINDTLKILFNKVSALSDSVHELQNIAIPSSLEKWYWIINIVVVILTLIAVVIYARVTYKTYNQIKEQSREIKTQSSATKSLAESSKAQTDIMLAHITPLLSYEFEKSKSIIDLNTKYGESKVLKDNDCLKNSDTISETVYINLSPYCIQISDFDQNTKLKPDICALIIKNIGNGIAKNTKVTINVTINVPDKFLNTHQLLKFPFTPPDDLIFDYKNFLLAGEILVIPIMYTGSFPNYKIELKEGSYNDAWNKPYIFEDLKSLKGNNEYLQGELLKICDNKT